MLIDNPWWQSVYQGVVMALVDPAEGQDIDRFIPVTGVLPGIHGLRDEMDPAPIEARLQPLAESGMRDKEDGDACILNKADDFLRAHPWWCGIVQVSGLGPLEDKIGTSPEGGSAQNGDADAAFGPDRQIVRRGQPQLPAGTSERPEDNGGDKPHRGTALDG